MDRDFKHGMISVSLIIVTLFSMVIIAAPVFATGATPPDNYVSVQQGGVFLLSGSITFNQAATGYFIWGPIAWFHNGNADENFTVENINVYWTSDNSAVENVSTSDFEIAGGHQINVQDNGDGIKQNGTFNIDIYLRAASGDGTLHKVDNDWIQFALDQITLFEPNPLFVPAGPIYVDVTGADVAVGVSLWVYVGVVVAIVVIIAVVLIIKPF